MATKAETPDTRNLQWRQNNVGSTLLQKMGWKHGEALGSKHRKKEEEVSGEGLKISKRREGLGLGADPIVVNEESTNHASFSQLLETLKKEHPASVDSKSSKKKKKKEKKRKREGGPENISKSTKKKKKETVFASNRITNSRVRHSKFAKKSAEDMACIFGKEYSSAQIAAQTLSALQEEKKLKKERKKEKKQREAENNTGTSTTAGQDENNNNNNSSSSSDNKQERKRKRKEEKKRKQKEQEEKPQTSDE